MYTRKGLTKHVTGTESLLGRDSSSPLITVVLPEMDFQYDREYMITKLHKIECLSQVSIPYEANQRKQTAFCPYCGVMNENTATAYSHARKHLGISFLCGGCYRKIYKKPQPLYKHLLSCQPAMVHQKEAGPQDNEGDG